MRLLSVLVSALLGAAVLTVLNVPFHWIFFRPALRDGQYALVVFVTVPVGAVLGGITGWVVAYHIQGQTAAAGRVAQLAGGLTTLIYLCLGLGLFSGTQKSTRRNRLAAVVFWFGLPLVWSALLCCTGFWLLAGR